MLSLHYEERPTRTTGVALQPRDRSAVHFVHRYRFLTAEHLRHLAYTGVTDTIVQRRLRKLWLAEFLDRARTFLPEGDHMRLSRPVYTLAKWGAELVGNDLGILAETLPSTPAANRLGFETLEHHLIVTDFLAALTAAHRTSEGAALRVLPESELRQKHRERRATGNRFPGVVPDGAFVICEDPKTKPQGFCIEVIRASTKAGNASVRSKLRRYVELNRHGFFKEAFGIEHLRAVLLITTSKARADHFQKLASGLPHGQSLFWSTYYERKGGLAMTFAPETVIGPIWMDGRGQVQSLCEQL